MVSCIVGALMRKRLIQAGVLKAGVTKNVLLIYSTAPVHAVRKPGLCNAARTRFSFLTTVFARHLTTGQEGCMVKDVCVGTLGKEIFRRKNVAATVLETQKKKTRLMTEGQHLEEHPAVFCAADLGQPASAVV